MSARNNDAAHPAAEFFPMMSDAEFSALRDDMAKNGYDPTKPALRWRGQTVDGRNRERAAKAAGVAVVYRDLPDDADPFVESYRANLLRRNLRQDQRAAIAIKVLRASNIFQSEQAEAKRRANEARAEKAREQPRTEDGSLLAKKSGGASNEARPDGRARSNKVTSRVANLAGVSRPTVERVLKIEREDPEAFEAVARGEPSGRRIDHAKREADVARLHGEGMGTHEIARSLGIAPTAVSKAKVKLGISSLKGAPKLWGDIEHVAATLCAAGPAIDRIVGELRGTQLTVTRDEVDRCISSLTQSLATIRSLQTALRNLPVRTPYASAGQ